MKKLLLILVIAVGLLTSCAPPTDEEIATQKRICDINGERVIIDIDNQTRCEYKTLPPSVMDCIREYTNGLDEKYNNPNNVSNLKEDDYTRVVRTCNEVFGSGAINK